MARIQVWTDEWVRHVTAPGELAKIVIHDPQISGHRLVVT